MHASIVNAHIHHCHPVAVSAGGVHSFHSSLKSPHLANANAPAAIAILKARAKCAAGFAINGKSHIFGWRLRVFRNLIVARIRVIGPRTCRNLS